MSEEQVIRKTISIYPSELKQWNELGKELALPSFSATLRFVLRDWKRLKDLEQQFFTELADNGFNVR